MKKQLSLLLSLSLLTVNLVNAQCSFTTALALSGPSVACGNVTLTAAATGNTWTQKTSYAGSSRQYAVGFSIGTKGYIGTGSSSSSNYLSDFWEYDPATNAWTQRANFGGTARYGAVGFSIGNKGYVGTGYDGSFKNDFWEYDPSTNFWSQKANFSGNARYLATGFSISSKGYIGTGTGGSNYNDFWEYDPSTNFWTQKASIGTGGRYYCVGMNIGSMGYIGTGYVNSIGYTNDFWEYNPTTNFWTQKANMGSTPVYGAVAFNIGNKGYVTTGYESANSLPSDKIWIFDPTNNTWTQGLPLGTANRRYFGAGFAVGLKGYVGTGYNSNYLNTFWEYEATGTYAWSNGATTQAITATVSGNYSVLITAGNGCTATASQSLSLSPNPNIAVSGASLSCAGTSNTLIASGAGSYTWSANAGGSNSNSVIVSPTVSTTYTLSGTTGGCTVNYPVILNVNPVPVASISASGPTSGCGTITLSTNAGGNLWTQKAGLNIGRRAGVGFSIGNKGYMGTGYNGNTSPYYFNDFWEYDPSTNAWTQKASLGSTGRQFAVGFGIGTKGYVGTGYNNSTYLNDFWEYDPALNTWTQKTNFAGGLRAYAVGFSIGNKGYIGTGDDWNTGIKNDFWEYDPSNNTWTQKTNLGGVARYSAVGFGISTKGYIGTGYNGSNLNDFWEYDPSNNTWTQKANVGSVARREAAAFAIGNKGYIGTGYTSNFANDFWEYDASANTWIQKANFGGVVRNYSSGFSIGGRGYIGIGNSSGSPVYMNDLWQYEPTSTVLWSTSSTLQAIPVSTTGTYSVTITNQAGCSASSSQTVALSPNPNISVSGASLGCAGTNNTLVASGAGSYTWSANAGGSNSNSVIVSPTISTTYTVSGTTGTCTVNYPVVINVNPVPVASISSSGPTSGCGTITLSTNAGGNTWTQKAGLNVGRDRSVGFSIGNKGYFGTGYNGNTSPYFFNDFWEYDPSTNAWTQKANIGSFGRYSSVGFSIGSKGYIGTGYNNGSSYLSDFWEYDPATNTWTQKANFTGGTRASAVGFAIGSKGYLGTGEGSNWPYTYNDFYEYDPSNNTWTQKASFGGVARYLATGFGIGSKGYLGTGYNGNNLNDFWEYDQNNNTWTQKANLSSVGRRDAAAFTIGNKGYIGTGYMSNYTNELWEYDVASNTWVQKANFGGATRSSARAFSISGRGYLGTGNSAGSPTYMNDLWQYEPTSTVLWSTSSTLQAIPVSTTGTYSVTITNQAGCSATASQTVALSPNPNIAVSGASLGCAGSSNTLVASGAGSYTWSSNAGGGNSNSVVVTPTTSTTYTVSGTTGTCTVNYPVSLNVNPVPVASISSSGPTSGCGTITLSTNAAGNTWTQKAGLNVGRDRSIAFSIGNKGYFGTGYNGNISPYIYNDFWEYDPNTNAWTQKANVGVSGRYSSVGFSIGSKGYVGTGYNNSSNYLNDFWEYDPALNTWTQKANFGGSARASAVGFSIGTKGYLGTGEGNISPYTYNDFYEYDPSNNTWTQKASFGGVARYIATGFGTSTKGYLGTGYNGSILSDFWEYNPVSNTWVQKASLSTVGRYGAVGFTIGNRGYIGTGYTGSNYSNEFWEYDIATNTWLQKANFAGITRYNASGFAIGGRGYLGIGYGSGSPTYMNDLWQYEPTSTVLWSTNSTLQAIPVSTTGTYSVTITNLAGCSATSSQTVALSPNPTITVSGASLSCAGISNSLVANGAGSYTWSANAGGGNSNSVVVTPTVSTIYTVSGTTGSCTVNYPVALNVNPVPVASISASGPTSGCGTITLSTNAGGNNWTQKAGLNVGRQYGVGFSIGNKGYMGTGSNGNVSPFYFNDFWEYDPGTNAWTQKANFGGTARYAAVAFSIGNKGYVGTGYDGSYKNDFWEYDPATNTWTQKANFGGGNRGHGIGFSIQTKGYIGTGYTGSGPSNDFWEYDPGNNTWTQKTSFGGTARYDAVGFNIGAKGYIGTGYDFTQKVDFWEYDPSANSWTQKANFAGAAREEATGFSINNLGYIGCGLASGYFNDFWEYDPNANTWTQRANFGGTARSAPKSFAIGSVGYIGTGYSNNSPNYMNDLWQYAPTSTILWSTSSTLQAIPVSTTGTYSVTITNQAGCSASASQTVALSPNPTISVSGASLACGGSSNTLVASGATSYTWSTNAGGGNSNSVVITPSATSVYTVTGITGSCVVNYPVTVDVIATPVATIIPLGSPTVCGTSLTMSTTIPGSNVWTQKVGLNTGRSYAIGLSINGKGYIGTGYSGSFYNDFWEFNPATNAWTQKANFGGGFRYGAVAITIGTKGYVGTGYDNLNTYKNDFWEYDPTLNTWTQKANFSGSARRYATGFTIGSKGYVGTGTGSSGHQSDFYEFDPTTNTWTQKASFAGTNRYLSTGFSISGKGYIGMGNDGTNKNDLWEYDAITNFWTQKASLGSSGRIGAAAFVLGNSAYVSGGNGSTDLWEYSPTLNFWTQKANFGGSYRYRAVGFAIGAKGYIGTGDGSFYYNDFWEYEPGVSYLWSTSASVPSITVTTSGNYSLTVTNVLGCSNTATQAVSISPAPVVNINGPNTICAGTVANFTANGASTYTWSANAGNATTASISLTPTLSGTYVVIGSANGCTATASKPVVVNALPVVTANSSTTSACQGNTVVLFGTGANTYTWSNPISNNVAFTPTITTTYTVSGTDFNICTNTAVVTVSVNARPTVSVNSGTICYGQNFTLTPNGANTYTYSGGSSVVSPTSNATYSVTGISVFGCTSSSPAIANVNVLASPSVAVNSGSICAGQNFTINPTGALTYSYSGGSAIVSPGSTTNYSVTGYSANGCFNAIPAIASVTVFTLPVISATSGSICAGNSYTIPVSGASSYTFSGGSQIVTPGNTTSYTVTGSNPQGCLSSNVAVATVTVNSRPTISASSNTLCNGRSYTLSATGANTYTYSSGSPVVSPNANTSYSISGTNSLGCASSSPAVITLSVLVSPTVSVSGGSVCAGGIFILNPTGATTYSYSNGSSTVSPTSTSSYTVTGFNANGCTNVAPAIATVSVIALPVVVAVSGSVCAGNTYTIPVSGASSYTYSSGSQVVNPSTTTSYSVIGSNAAGCVSSGSAVATVTVNAIPVIALSSNTLCNGQNYTLNPSGANTYTYSGGFAVVSPSVNTTYSVSGTSVFGCVSASPAIATISVIASPTVSVNSGSICSGQAFTLSPNGALSYSYSGGSAVVTPTSNSTYTVTGYASNGCPNSTPAIANVSVYALPAISATSGSICIGSSYTIPLNGAASYTFLNGSQVVSPTITTTYSIVGTSSVGCVNSNPVVSTVTVNSIPVITITDGTVCSGQSYTLNPSGANTYTYSGGSAVVSPTNTTTYSVSGISISGCPSASPAIATLTVYALPVVTASGGVVCAGNPFTITPGGASTYTYSSGSAIVNPTITTTYSVTGTNTLGCNSASPAIITVTANPLPNITVNSGTVCSGKNFTMVPSGALTYTYSGGSAVVNPTVNSSYSVTGTNTNGCTSTLAAISQVSVIANPTVVLPTVAFICTGNSYTISPSGANNYTYSGGSNVVTPSLTTSYTVSGNSSQGCIGQAVITVSVQPSLTVTISGSTTVCEGNSVTLTGNGGNTYTWSTGAVSNSILVSPATATVYTVSSGSGNCSGASSHSLTVNANPTVVVASSNTLICVNESATITASGANTYLWNDGSSTAFIVVSPTAPAVYSVTGTDANGCINSAVVSQSVTDCTGILETSGDESAFASVYPNPNNGRVFVELNRVTENTRVELYNYIGQLILSKKVSQATFELEYEHAANGMYTLKVINNDKVMFKAKIIKQ